MSLGGAEKVLIDLVNNLNPKKYDITILMIYKNNIYNTINDNFIENFNNNIRLRYICNNNNRILYMLFNFMLNKINNKWFHKLFIGNKFDVEIAFYEGLPTKIMSNSINKKSKKIAWIHTDANNRIKYLDKDKFKEEEKIYLKYNKIIAVSETVKKSFIENFDHKNKVEVKYNPIDSKQIILKSKNELNLSIMNKFKLCSVGRLTKVKGYDRLINVLGKLKNEGFDFELWLIGNGEEHMNLQEKVEELNLEENIKFLGFQENPYKYISKCDLVVCSSFAEGYSTSILEAVVLGKPILTTECSGMKEIFGDKTCGIICDNSENGLYIALKKIINNKEKLLSYYGKESSRRGKEFNLKNIIYQLEEIF